MIDNTTKMKVKQQLSGQVIEGKRHCEKCKVVTRFSHEFGKDKAVCLQCKSVYKIEDEAYQNVVDQFRSAGFNIF